MNRTLALVLLILMAVVLLHSLYSFYHGRFGEAMVMYPLLVVCYLVFLGRGKWKLNREDDDRPPQS
ncbi:DUF2752 domain-containing protein [Desulfurivibrio alkaliphilus]|uniref:Uncharacterized protein n=1 Tax=Desulfurivibrio alkaliphilus (strain DSM 19089 / UNIQEM U267 / AHT2) TaxID=589865 RepID=D6Z463_DESAT|nr:DUF2752 domain-containing protein [Desulfurivibrio alkaliphilus]ADH86338.1 conserved hypothetical protein [Desulfurivibrio alkaliphilus AHT 2]